jgi:hypothetical protein
VALTPKEQEISRMVWAVGSAALYELEWEQKQVQAFMSREDVLGYLAILNAEATAQMALAERHKFIAMRRLRRMSNQAMDILEDALAGPGFAHDQTTGEILRDARGHPILRTLPPDEMQVLAAKEILDRSGIVKGESYDPSRDSGMTELIREGAKPIEIEYAPGSEEAAKTISRESMRITIERVKVQLPEIKKKYGLDNKHKPRVKPKPSLLKVNPITGAKIVSSKVTLKKAKTK